MKLNLTTITNRIIKQFVKDMKKKHGTKYVDYCWVEPKFKSAEEARLDLDCGFADYVFWNEKTKREDNPRRRHETSRLFLRFHFDDGNFPENTYREEALFVDMTTGEGFYTKTGMENAMRLGVLDEDDIKVLVPLYNKMYLDRWAKNYDEGAVSKGVVGIHNEFTLLAQSIVNPIISINKPIERKIGAKKECVIDEYDLIDKRLVFVKSAHLPDNEVIYFG